MLWENNELKVEYAPLDEFKIEIYFQVRIFGKEGETRCIKFITYLIRMSVKATILLSG